MSWGTLQPFVRGEWQRRISGSSHETTAFLLSAANFPVVVPLASEDRDFGNVALGVQAVLPRNWSAYFNYQRVFSNDNYESDRFQFGVRIPF